MSTLFAILLSGVFAVSTSAETILADKEGFDACIAAVNADPELGGDSDYLHCDVQFDPYMVLYADSDRWDRDERADYRDIMRPQYTFGIH